MRQAEAPADDPRVAEEPADLVGPGVGGDVEVLRPAPEHEVAHAAPDEQGAKARLVQAVEDLERVAIDEAAGDRMLRSWKDSRLDDIHSFHDDRL